MKRTIWQPLVLGAAMGLLAGLAAVTELSISIVDFLDNTSAIGFYLTLFLLAAAFGGPLAAVVAPAIYVAMSAALGPPGIQELLGIPEVFWSNILALGICLALVSLAYRWIFERVRMPWRLPAWAGIIVVFYIISLPASISPQYILLEGPIAELPPAIISSYTIYLPQAVFDIIITSLVFIALPVRYRRPLWYEPKRVQAPANEVHGV